MDCWWQMPFYGYLKQNKYEKVFDFTDGNVC